MALSFVLYLYNYALIFLVKSHNIGLNLTAFYESN